MTAPFVTSLRTRRSVVEVGNQETTNLLHLRVQLAEAWDAIRIDIASDELVKVLKVHALQTLAPGVLFHDDYVVKFRGKEIFDESKSLQQVGALDGSIFLLHLRRRRPVR